jgi:hypothetical protein
MPITHLKKTPPGMKRAIPPASNQKIRRLTSDAQIDAEVGEAAGRRLAALS